MLEQDKVTTASAIPTRSVKTFNHYIKTIEVDPIDRLVYLSSIVRRSIKRIVDDTNDALSSNKDLGHPDFSFTIGDYMVKSPSSFPLLIKICVMMIPNTEKWESSASMISTMDIEIQESEPPSIKKKRQSVDTEEVKGIADAIDKILEDSIMPGLNLFYEGHIYNPSTSSVTTGDAESKSID